MPIRILDENEPTPQTRQPEPAAAPAPAPAQAAPAAQTGTLEDVMRSILAGAQRGVASVPGMLGDVQSLGEQAAVWGRGKLAGPEAAEELRRSQQAPGAKRILPTTEEIVQNVEPYSPSIAYEPQTTAGEFARTGMEFGTGALVTAPLTGARTAAGVARTVAGQGLAPGLASEAAGQATEGTSMEGPARLAGALAGGVAGGIAAAPTTPETVLGRAAGNVTPQQLDEAEALFMEGQRLGVPVSRAQALHRVTGGATSLPDVQRVVEGSGAMRGFFAPTAQGIETAGDAALGAIGPEARQRAMIGPQVAEAAQGSLDRTQGRINDLTRPLYQRAEGHLIPAEDMAQLMANPVYRQTVSDLRTNPTLQAHTEGMVDNSVQFNDLVQRRMGEALDRNDPADPRSTTPLERAGIETPRQAVREAADAASAGEYGNALAEGARLRQRYLEPLRQGPLGRLANSQTTESAVNALFPGDPRALPSAEEVSRAVSGVVNSPGGAEAGRQLVRSYLQSTFDQATKQVQGGPNQWGGATFNAMVRGNPQVAANLQAAITSLPNGRETWQGFERFLDVLGATGARQRQGSATAFNNELIREMERGSVGADLAKTATGTPFAVPSRIREQIDRMVMGRNVNEIADILTNPRQAQRFRDLATAEPGSARAVRLVGSIAAIAQRSGNANKEYDRSQPQAGSGGFKVRIVD